MDRTIVNEVNIVHTNGTLTHADKVRLFAKFVNHQYAAAAVLFEIITGSKPPRLKELLRLL